MRSPAGSYHLTDLTGPCRQSRAHTITDLAERLRRLAPSSRNPERFHEEKSEIVNALRVIAQEVAHG